MFRVNNKAVFSKLTPDVVECEGCKYLYSWVEKYEIAGSTETEREYGCSGKAHCCQRVDEEAEKIEGFMADNADMFQNIEWID